MAYWFPAPICTLVEYIVEARVVELQEYRIELEPYYEPLGQEIKLFETAHKKRLPLLLKGPTGCGKTRFMEHMAWRLQQPLITVACHDDLTAADLVGRYLITAGETVWVDACPPFCVTIDTEARDYLPHMYGAVNYTFIDKLERLPLKVADIYRKLTF